jgi:hypothetical protein
MVMSDPQFWSITDFVSSLRQYRRRMGLPGYVASMLPIRYTEPGIQGRRPRRKKVAPDTFLAFVPDRERSSYNLKAEGKPPAFVLEVVSPSSVKRDEQDKVRLYDLLQVEEYALFTPGGTHGSTLKGYRRGASGRFVPWQPDPAGRLWSEALELWLVVRNGRLRAETREGMLLQTLPELDEAQGRAEEIAREALQRAERLEAELAAERAELARLRALQS